MECGSLSFKPIAEPGANSSCFRHTGNNAPLAEASALKAGTLCEELTFQAQSLFIDARRYRQRRLGRDQFHLKGLAQNMAARIYLDTGRPSKGRPEASVTTGRSRSPPLLPALLPGPRAVVEPQGWGRPEEPKCLLSQNVRAAAGSPATGLQAATPSSQHRVRQQAFPMPPAASSWSSLHRPFFPHRGARL